MDNLDEKIKKRFFWKSFFQFFLPSILAVLFIGSLSLFFVGNNLRKTIRETNHTDMLQTARINDMLFNDFTIVNLMVNSDTNILNSLFRLTKGDGSFTADDIKTARTFSGMATAIMAVHPGIKSLNVYFPQNQFYFSTVDGVCPIGQSLMEEIAREGANLAPSMQDFLITRNEDGSIRNMYLYQKISTDMAFSAEEIDWEKTRSEIVNTSSTTQQSFFLSDGKESLSFDDASLFLEMKTVFSADISSGEVVINHVQYRLVKIQQSSWYFIIRTPLSMFFKVIFSFILLTTSLMLFALVLAFVLAWRNTTKNFQGVLGIIDTFAKIDKGESVTVPNPNQDVYSYIIYRINKNGILRHLMSRELTEKKYQMNKLELRALQYQINPHFLINTLKSVYWQEVKTQGMDGSNAIMVEDLLDIVGYSLNKMGKNVSLKEEIEHTKSFCDILVRRHAKELSVVWNYPDGLATFEGVRLILQPFIENAFYHGIRNSESGHGTITITVQEGKDTFTIHIKDDGCGMDQSQVEAINKGLESTEIPNQHLGIYNPHRRIVLKYGNDYGVHITSQKGAFTDVRILLPKIPYTQE